MIGKAVLVTLISIISPIKSQIDAGTWQTKCINLQQQTYDPKNIHHPIVSSPIGIVAIACGVILTSINDGKIEQPKTPIIWEAEADDFLVSSGAMPDKIIWDVNVGDFYTTDTGNNIYKSKNKDGAYVWKLDNDTKDAILIAKHVSNDDIRLDGGEDYIKRNLRQLQFEPGAWIQLDWDLKDSTNFSIQVDNIKYSVKKDVKQKEKWVIVSYID